MRSLYYTMTWGLALVSSLVLADPEPEPARITPAPRLVARGQRLGWASEDGEWFSVSCPGIRRVFTSDSFAFCGTSNRQAFFTACNSGVGTWNTGGTRSCTGFSSVCITDLVYETIGDTSPITMIGCGPAGVQGFSVIISPPATAIPQSLTVEPASSFGNAAAPTATSTTFGSVPDPTGGASTTGTAGSGSGSGSDGSGSGRRGGSGGSGSGSSTSLGFRGDVPALLYTVTAAVVILSAALVL